MFLDENVRNTIGKLINIRKQYPALQSGEFKIVHLESEILAFLRWDNSDRFLVVINIDSEERSVSLTLNDVNRLDDLLNEGEFFHPVGQQVNLNLYSSWGRILKIS